MQYLEAIAFEDIAVRTGIDYCAYIARHRPIGKRPPSAQIGGDSLVQLRAKHQDAGAKAKAARKAEGHEETEPAAEADPDLLVSEETGKLVYEFFDRNFGAPSAKVN